MPFGPILRSMSHNRVRFVLIILEIAITLAIVTNCVNMILASRQSMLKKSGFDDDHLVFVLSRRYTRYADANAAAQAVDRDVRALQALPGVRAAANTYLVPWQGGGNSDTYRAASGAMVQAQVYDSSPGIFDTLGVRVAEGRAFTPQDYADPSASPTSVNVVVSRAFERLLFPNGGKGLGENPCHPGMAAVANAIYNAVGVRLREVPFTRAKILKALSDQSARPDASRTV